MKYRVIIAGGRKYSLTPRDIQTLNGFTDTIAEVVTGECKTGADYDAKLWAQFFNIPHKGFPADFKNLGRPAGPIRNSQMINYVCGLDDYPGMLIVFPGGKGTQDITNKAIKAGLKVLKLADGIITKVTNDTSGDDDITIDPGYQKFLEEIAEDCKCCPECHECPCGSCQAGAPCDAYECTCNDDHEDYDEFYEHP